MVHIIANNLVKNKTHKRVSQYTLKGKFMKTFESITQAAQVTGANREHISAVCKGKEKYSGGFIWKYTETP